MAESDFFTVKREFVKDGKMQYLVYKSKYNLDLYINNLEKTYINNIKISNKIYINNNIIKTVKILNKSIKSNPLFIFKGNPIINVELIVKCLAELLHNDSVPQKLRKRKVYLLEKMPSDENYQKSLCELTHFCKYKPILFSTNINDILLFNHHYSNLQKKGRYEIITRSPEELPSSSYEKNPYESFTVFRGQENLYFHDHKNFTDSNKNIEYYNNLISFISCLSMEQYDYLISNNPINMNIFSPLIINDNSIDEILDLLDLYIDDIAKFHEIEIDKSAIEESAYLSHNFRNSPRLFVNALDLIDETVSDLNYQLEYYPDEFNKIKSDIALLHKKHDHLLNLDDKELENDILKQTQKAEIFQKIKQLEEVQNLLIRHHQLCMMIRKYKILDKKAYMAGDLDKVADIRYGKIVELEKELIQTKEKIPYPYQYKLNAVVTREDVSRIFKQNYIKPVEDDLLNEN